jgi:hypothetical protein
MRITRKSPPSPCSVRAEEPTPFDPAPPETTVDMTFWNSADCAEFFRCARRHFMECIKPVYSFPPAHYLPRIDGVVSRPLWRASEVREWAERTLKSSRADVRRWSRDLKRVA